MRARTLLLLFLAFVIAGGTALLAQSWLQAQRARETAEAAPLFAPKPTKSVLVARADLKRGQILRPDDMVWQIWPDGALDKNYLVMGGPRTPDAFAGWVVRNPVGGGEPITEGKIISPGDRGFLAAVLRPGMRAISVQVTNTSATSGFVFPGDQVDMLLSYPLPTEKKDDGDGSKIDHQHKASQTVLRNIRVIGIDKWLEGKQGEAFQQPHTATFEVTAKQSEIIALASEMGKVSLTLRSLVPDPADAEDAVKLAGSAGVVAAGAAGGNGADSPISANATYTIDSDISPLLPKLSRSTGDDTQKRGTGKDGLTTGTVTILRGGGKGEESKASGPAPKGS
jgi:pilus assembly protein CpaB